MPRILTHSYVAISPLLGQIGLASHENEITAMTMVKQYDKLNRLMSMNAMPANTAQLPLSYGSQYNDANQRTRVTLQDGSYWVYQYDSLGQVTSGKKYFADNTPVAGQQFEYAHDDIGNRTSTKAGGDQYGQNLRSASYTPNSLNQYTSRTVPGGFDMVGAANKDATVTVDGNDVQYRRGEYWRQYVSVDNEGVPVWRSVSVTTTGGGSATGGVFVPKTAEIFVYDLDGNLTSDGRWTYVWDGENRLIRMVANTTVGPQQRIDFEYDWKGRRIGKKVWGNTQGTGNPSLTRKFLYDGWNLIAELDGNNTPVRSYAWGLDVSGSFQGAGGVGGLLMVKDATQGTHFAAYDLNGNVMGLVNAANGTLSAQYEYGPFGEVIRMTGAMARLNPFRFSTKYQDDETDLLYYGYRYYNASMGRWLRQDPIGEKGGVNLYGFVGNDVIHKCDLLGMFNVINEGKFNAAQEFAISSQIVRACGKNFNTYVNADCSLRNCIAKLCQDGNIVLSARTPTHVANGTISGTLGEASDTLSNKVGKGKNVTLFPNNGTTSTDWGGVVIHEFAHCCGWAHGGGGLNPSISSSTM